MDRGVLPSIDGYFFNMIFIFYTDECVNVLAEAKKEEAHASDRVKELEYKIKNAKAIREKELKQAEQEVKQAKKKIEESQKKAKEKEQVCCFNFLSQLFSWSFKALYI